MHTEKWNTGRVSEMQGFSVFAKVLCTSHKPAHLFQNCGRASAYLAPRPT